MKPQRQAQGCILWRSMVFDLLGDDRPVGCGKLFNFLWNDNLAHSIPSNHMLFLLLLAACLHGVHRPWSHRSVVRWGGHMRCLCVYCLCRACLVLFSTRAPEQSLTTANLRRPETLIVSSSSMWKTSATEIRYSFHPNGLSQPGERAHDRYLISAVSGIRTHNILIDSPACYH